MSNGRQVDSTLVIRARDEASKAVNAIESALQDLFGTQKQVASGSQSVATGISSTVTALAGLDRAYSQIAGAADRGSDGFQRQLSTLAANQAQLAALTKQLDNARTAQERMNDFVGPRSPADLQRYAGVAAEVKNLETTIKSLSRTIDGQQTGLTRSASTLGDVARQVKLVGAVETFARTEAEAFTRELEAQTRVAENNARALAAIQGSTDSTTGKSAADSADVFSRAGLTAIEKEIAATERATAAERDHAAAIRMSDAAMRARARREGNGDTASSASETTLARMLRDEEDAAQAAAAAENELAEAAARLRAELNPMAAIQDKLNRELLEAQRLYDKGAIDARELAAAQEMLRKSADRAAQSIGRQGAGNNKLSLFGLKPYEIQNLGFQVNDVVTQLASGTSLTQTLAQQGGQILQIFPQAGASIVAAFSNPAVAAFAATLGVIVVGIREAASEARSLRQFEGLIAATFGDRGGATAEQLRTVTRELDRYGLSAAEAVKITRNLFDRGLSARQIADFGVAAKDLTDVLGIDLTEATELVGDAFTGSFEALDKLMQKTKAFSPAQRQQIKDLYDQGKAAEGAEKAFAIFAAKMDEGAKKARGPWAEAFRKLENNWDKLVQSLGDSWWAKGAIAAIDGLADAADRYGESIKNVTSLWAISPLGALIAGAVADNAAPQVAGGGSGGGGGGGWNDRGTAEQQAAAQRLRKETEQRLTLEGKITSQKVLQDRLDALAAQEYAKLGNTVTKQVADEHVSALLARERVKLDKELADYKKQQADAAKREREEQERLAKQIRFIDPVTGRMSSGFGPRVAPKAGASTFHKGIDFAVSVGTPVRAPADGVVIETGVDSKLGKYVYINHGNGVVSKFGHLSDTSAVRTGQVVRQGDVIAKSGNTGNSTGPHLHFQTEVNGKPVDPRKGQFERPGRFGSDLADAIGEQEKAANQLQKKQDEFGASLDRTLAAREEDTRQLNEQLGLTGDALLAKQREAAIEDAIRKAKDDATRAGVAGDDPELLARIARLREVEGAYFDAQHAREAFDNDRADVDKPVADLTALRDQLQQQIQFAQERGQTGFANQLEEQLAGVNDQLKEAVANALEFYQALQPGTAAFPGTQAELDAIILRLQTAGQGAQNLGYFMGIAGQQIAQQFTNAAVSALDQFSQAVAGGENVVKSFGRAILQMAADFLRSIAQMILQQIIFNAVSGVLGGLMGGSGKGVSLGAVAGIKAHDGGVVGMGSLVQDDRQVAAILKSFSWDSIVRGQGGSGPTIVQPEWFRNARRYHTGGIAGLRPDEVPAILQRNEEVLTTGDPRHRFNGAGASAPVEDRVKVVNYIDATAALEAALATKPGQKVLLNHIRANKVAYSGALGG